MKSTIYLFVFTLSLSAITLKAQYNQTELNALTSIKQNCDLNDSLNWYADSDPVSWTGVFWTSTAPYQVRSLSVSDKSLVGTLDVTALTALQNLNCNDNQLSSLLVNGLASVTNLQCEANQFTELNLSGLTSLSTLNCINNLITDINLTDVTSVVNFYCSGNNLKSLDLTEVLDYYYIVRCDSNKLSNLITPDKYSSLISCANNHLPFSVLAALPVYEGQLLPQHEIFEAASYETDVTLDYSSEALINDVTTTFTFFKNDIQVEENSTGTYQTQGTGTYCCKMLNTSFYIENPIVITAPVSIGEVYYQIDVDAIKDIDADCDAENQLNWNTNSPIDWEGVSWTQQTEASLKRVSHINVRSKKMTGNLDVTDLSELVQLDCSDNELSALDVSGLVKLETLIISDNPIPISDLAIGLDIDNFEYSDTVTIFEPDVVNGFQAIDYSSEALINGVSTQFVFYKDRNEVESNTSGIYTPTEPGVYYCSMTNPELPGVIQNTAEVTVLLPNSINSRNVISEMFYPNPAYNRIVFTNPSNISNVTIYSLNGKVVLQSDSSSEEMDISILGKGIYLIKINQKDTVITQKLIVQ